MDYQFVSDASKNRPRVLEDYEFNEHVRIGRGSYGQVYKAREKSSNNSMTFYALKEVELAVNSTCREIAVCFNCFYFYISSIHFNNIFIQLYREIKHRNIMDLLKVYFSYSEQKVNLCKI